MLERNQRGQLSQLFELCLDSVEVWEVTRAFQGLSVLDNARFIDDEGGALWHATHDQVFGWKEAVVGDAVSGGDFMVVVAQELKGDTFFLSPDFLSEGIVTTDAKNFGVQIIVGVDAFGDLAELCGADACEGHRHEQKQDVGGADVLAQLEKLRAIGAKGGDGEIRGGSADGECHCDG